LGDGLTLGFVDTDVNTHDGSLLNRVGKKNYCLIGSHCSVCYFIFPIKNCFSIDFLF